MAKKLVYIAGALASGCASAQLPVCKTYKWDSEKNIVAIVEEPGVDAGCIDSHVLVSSDKPIGSSYAPYALSCGLFGVAGLCLVAAAYLKLTKGEKKEAGKKHGFVKINLLPPEYRAGRLRKAIRFLYNKLPKRELEDYPMPGYSNEGWNNYGGQDGTEQQEGTEQI